MEGWGGGGKIVAAEFRAKVDGITIEGLQAKYSFPAITPQNAQDEHNFHGPQS